jgi:hypothetical protein
VAPFPTQGLQTYPSISAGVVAEDGRKQKARVFPFESVHRRKKKQKSSLPG